MDSVIKEIISHLKQEETLPEWQEKARNNDRESVEEELYAYFLDRNDYRDFSCFDEVTYSLFIHGLQCICWESVYDELRRDNYQNIK